MSHEPKKCAQPAGILVPAQIAAALPCAHDENDLPVGLQLVAKRWDEARLLGIACSIAQVAEGFRRPAALK
ncbi:MAG TPA: hypothetical protein VIQ74_11230 [Gemmatimonadaceae bacterium]